MTYSLSNNCTKNYYNRTLTVQVIVEDVVTWIFLRHSVVYYTIFMRKTLKLTSISIYPTPQFGMHHKCLRHSILLTIKSTSTVPLYFLIFILLLDIQHKQL